MEEFASVGSEVGFAGAVGSVLTIFNSITVGGITLEGTYIG